MNFVFLGNIFEGFFKIMNSSSTTLTAYVLDSDNHLIDSIPMPKKEAGYLFRYSFQDLGTYQIKVVNPYNNQVCYESITVMDCPDEPVTELKVKLLATVSDDYITGGSIDESFFEISGVPAPNESVNGKYTPWGLRNFESNSGGSVVENVPMFVNGSHAIYAITSTPTSGTEITEGEYEWHISSSGYVYNQLINQGTTYLSANGRELISMNKVVFSGTLPSIDLESSDIIKTESKYGNVFSSDEVVGSGVDYTESTSANFTLNITNNATNEQLSVFGVFEEGQNRDYVLNAMNNAAIEAVNGDDDFNSGYPWSLDDNYKINTNQPIETLYGGSIVVDNTDGQGTVGDVQVIKE